MDYRNADGSLAEMCGNGVRCVAKLVLDHGWVAGDRVAVDTRAGVKHVTVTARHDDGTVAAVAVDLGAARVGDPLDVDISPLTRARAAAPTAEEAVTAEQRTLRVLPVSLGNPHAVVLVGADPAALDAVPLADWARWISAHEAFPDGANVEAIAVPAATTLHGRIHERGSGETLSSGTGASAMAVAAAALGHADREATVRLPGGDLEVAWGADGTVTMSGPAEIVATGALDAGWLSRTRAAHERAAEGPAGEGPAAEGSTAEGPGPQTPTPARTSHPTRPASAP